MTTIAKRRIGKHGPEAGLLALGSWHTYDRMPFAETVELLREARAVGITLFDVGVYGTPDLPPVFTDVIFGAAVRAAGLNRDDYLLSAKLWLEDYPEQSLRAQLDHALMRAGTGHADVAILGDIHGKDVDLERMVLDLAELHDLGLIKAWGVNNYSAVSVQTMIDAAARHQVAGPVIAQLKYSVARRAVADGPPFAEIFAQGVTLEASDVLEGGLLLGKSGRAAGRDPGGVQQRIRDQAAPELSRLSADLSTTPAQLAIAFTLTHPHLTTTLFGATSLAQFRDNLGAVDLLARVGPERLRELCTPMWVDRDSADPAGP